MPITRSTLLATLALTLCASCQQAPAPKPSAPAAQFTDVDNHPVDPFSRSNRATVLLFIAHDCPISNSYAPEIHRLCDAYTNQGIAFYLVYPDPDTTPDIARQHHNEYHYTCPALLDRNHALVKRANATVTPEAAVFLPDGSLIYRGRIDDVAVAYHKSRQSPTTRDLQTVLDRITQNRLLTPTFTQAVGCNIPDLK